MSYLHWAVARNKIEFVKGILKSCNENALNFTILRKDSEGRTALDIAREHGFLECELLLLEHINQLRNYKRYWLERAHGQNLPNEIITIIFKLAAVEGDKS